MKKRGLYWKEWREVRLVFILVVGLAVLIPHLFAHFLSTCQPRDRIVGTIVLVWFFSPVLITSALVPPEWGGRTAGFLFSLPTRRGRIWLAKFLVGLACLVAVVFVSEVANWAISRSIDKATMTFRETWEFREIRAQFPVFVAVVFLWFGINFFASTVCSRAMTSVVAGLVVNAGITRLMLNLVHRWVWPFGGHDVWEEIALVVVPAGAFLFASRLVFTRAAFLGGTARFKRGLKYLAFCLVACLALEIPLGLFTGQTGWDDIQRCWGGLRIIPSPGGKVLLVAGNAKGAPYIWRASADGTGMRCVGGRWSWAPAWSPDGKKIAFVCQGGSLGFLASRPSLWLMTPDGSGKRCLVDEIEFGWDQSLLWSADGRFIAWEDLTRRCVWVAEADGSSTWELRPEEGENYGLGSWSPEGHNPFLFKTEGPEGEASLWRVSYDGKNPSLVAENVTPSYLLPSVVIGRQYILFARPVREDPLNSLGELWILERQGSRTEKLLTRRLSLFMSYGLSADEKRVYFTSPANRKREWCLWIANVNGSQRQKVGRLYFSVLSPDGKEIAFHGEIEGEESGVWVVPFDAHPKPCLVGPGGREPQWLSDERLIYWGKDGGLWAVGRNGEDRKKILPEPPLSWVEPRGRGM